MTNMEKRGGVHGVETRADGGKKTLMGYAAVFNSDTTIGDYFIERIDPHAFDKAIAGDVRALVDHDTGRVIGRTKSGTLRLAVDSRGLKVEIDIPDTADGRDLWTLVERGDISGMSFGFRVTKQEWDETGDLPVRTVLEVELYEVSACAFPAYDDTSLGVRSLEEARAEAEKAMADRAKKETDAAAARRRVAEREARQEQRIRGIQADAS
ncbi:HK97 family phage prohead protease [Mesorhizobium sp. BR-1-1-8]|uniref:HK97 family phage prohead protease n=1 Tax=unclassified Mesorhizobium TaxID=325217 RepID=UPI001CCFAB09|nr:MULTISPECIES: HK97 family phage prohead protease [unclassified Mesorhizobium]MBZ9973499.1 HK97 family phage prohead protease [Mesorhizobium sp. BR1-1-12]MBZ9984942.1 HK97 family phage prohead protease [Mesorhizobium sp. BR-1-1-8]